MNRIVYRVFAYLFCVVLTASCSSQVERYGVFPDVHSLERYLSDGGDPNAIPKKDQKSRAKRTLLRNAASDGDASMVSMVVKAGGNPNVVDVGGWTPLVSLLTTRDEVKGWKSILEVLLPVTDKSVRAVYAENALQV